MNVDSARFGTRFLFVQPDIAKCGHPDAQGHSEFRNPKQEYLAYRDGLDRTRRVFRQRLTNPTTSDESNVRASVLAADDYTIRFKPNYDKKHGRDDNTLEISYAKPGGDFKAVVPKFNPFRPSAADDLLGTLTNTLAAEQKVSRPNPFAFEKVRPRLGLVRRDAPVAMPPVSISSNARPDKVTMPARRPESSPEPATAHAVTA